MKFDLIDSAMAQTANATTAGFDWMQFAPLMVIFVAFYFILIRPQQNKAKQQRAMLDTLKVGDEVVTASGILGRVAKIVDANEILLKVAPEVEIRILRSTIAQIFTAGTMGNAVSNSGNKTEVKSAKKPTAKKITK